MWQPSVDNQFWDLLLLFDRTVSLIRNREYSDEQPWRKQNHNLCNFICEARLPRLPGKWQTSTKRKASNDATTEAYHYSVFICWLSFVLHIVLEHVTSPFGSLKNFERNLFLAGPSSTSMLENSFCSSSDSSPLPPVDLRSSLPWDNRRMSERLDDGERSGEWGLFVGHERSKGCIWTSTILCVFFLGHFRLLPHHFLSLTIDLRHCVNDASEPLSLDGWSPSTKLQHYSARLQDSKPALELSCAEKARPF